MDNPIQNIPNSPMPRHSSNQFVDIITELSPSDYVNLVIQVIDYQKVIRQEEIQRDMIKEQCQKDLAIKLKELESLEKKITSDAELLRFFIEETMQRIDKLFEDKQYDIADKLHERVSNNLQGKVNQVAHDFNQRMGSNISLEIGD